MVSPIFTWIIIISLWKLPFEHNPQSFRHTQCRIPTFDRWSMCTLPHIMEPKLRPPCSAPGTPHRWTGSAPPRRPRNGWVPPWAFRWPPPGAPPRGRRRRSTARYLGRRLGWLARLQGYLEFGIRKNQDAQRLPIRKSTILTSSMIIAISCQTLDPMVMTPVAERAHVVLCFMVASVGSCSYASAFGRHEALC